MPIYEYKCRKCHKITEQIQGYDDPGPKCPSCSGKTDKVMSGGSFQLKGGGWYKSGYVHKPDEGKKKAAPCAEGKAEGAPACAGCPKVAAGD